MAFIYRDQAGVLLRAVSWSPDSTRIASASSNGAASKPAGLVQVWDATAGNTLLSYRGHPSGALDVAWSPEGERLASAGGPDGTVQVWEADSGRELMTFQDQQRAAWAAQARQNENARRAKAGVGLLFDPLIPATELPQWVQALGWSPDGERIASTCSNVVHVWEVATGRPFCSYGSHRMHVRTLAWSPVGTSIASLTGWLIHLWEARARAQGRFIYRGHAGEGCDVFSLAWSPDGTRLASGTTNGTVQVWSATTGEHLLDYGGHNPDLSIITQPANEPEDPQLVEKMLNAYLSQWLDDPRFSTATPRERLKLLGEYTERNARAAAARARGESALDRPRYRPAPSIAVTALAWSPDGIRIASGSLDTTVQVWDTRTGEQVFTYRDHTAAITDVAWSPDGARIASADTVGLVHVWSCASRELG